MIKKDFILPLLLAALFLLPGCKDSKQAPAAGDAAEAAEAAEASVETAVEPAYDLEAIARAIQGCDYLENFKNGVASFRKDGVWMYVDKLGRLVDEAPAEEPQKGLRVDYEKGRKGYVNEKGELVIDHKYQYAGEFHEGLCWVYLDDGENEGIGYINEKDELVIPCQFEWAVDYSPCDFHEGLCPVMTIPERELFSYIDKTGAIAFPGYYHSDNNFSEGLAGVRESIMDGDDVVGTRSGYIDKTGKMVILLDENCSGKEFHEGIAKVYAYMDNQAWMIDREGNKLFDLDPDIFYTGEDLFFSEGLCAFGSRTGQWGFLDKTGRTTLEFE